MQGEIGRSDGASDLYGLKANLSGQPTRNRAPAVCVVLLRYCNGNVVFNILTLYTRIIAVAFKLCFRICNQEGPRKA
jgi:hypothetical protein